MKATPSSPARTTVPSMRRTSTCPSTSGNDSVSVPPRPGVIVAGARPSSGRRRALTTDRSTIRPSSVTPGVSKRADQSARIRSLPRRSWRSALIPHPSSVARPPLTVSAPEHTIPGSESGRIGPREDGGPVEERLESARTRSPDASVCPDACGRRRSRSPGRAAPDPPRRGFRGQPSPRPVDPARSRPGRGLVEQPAQEAMP